jgi:hypothetical protein
MLEQAESSPKTGETTLRLTCKGEIMMKVYLLLAAKVDVGAQAEAEAFEEALDKFNAFREAVHPSEYGIALFGVTAIDATEREILQHLTFIKEGS